MIIDHISITVSNYKESKDFYLKALSPLGYKLVMEIMEWRGVSWAGFGINKKADFWISEGDKVQNPMHIAFLAENKEQVRDFYEAAMETGAKDNGPPGIRTIYHPNYYGAFVIGPDGHNIEAVCHKPE